MKKSEKNSFNYRFLRDFPKATLKRVKTFFNCFFNFFQKKTTDLSDLVGRVKEIQDDAGVVLDQLEQIKEELENEVGGHRYSMIKEVLDPMIRRVKRIFHLLHQTQDPFRSLDLATEQSKWTEKAKLWVRLYTKSEKKEIAEVILVHIVEKTCEHIDRDIDLISEYAEQLLNEVNSSQREVFKKEIFPLVKLHIENLEKLKIFPSNLLSWEEVGSWRKKIEEKRSIHLNLAFQTMDTFRIKTNLFNKMKSHPRKKS